VDIKQNRKKYREEELMDKCYITIDNESKSLQRKKRKAIKKIKENEFKLWSYKYITRNVGRREKSSLQKLMIKDNNEQIIDCLYNKE